MGSDSHRDGTPQGAGHTAPRRSRTLEENVETIKVWERALLHERSRAEQLSDWITGTVASTPILAAHVVWFLGWISLNVGAFGAKPYDPFPFPFLTMTVSLEAIFLTLFVIASQSRLARLADRRAHLNLQIDLLAEREMTAVLQILQDIAAHLEVKETVTSEQIRDLASRTDLRSLTHQMDTFEEDVQKGAA